jgi:hypothetical protein
MQPVHENNLRTFVGLTNELEAFNKNYSAYSLLGRAFKHGLRQAISGEEAEGPFPRQPTSPGSDRHANDIFQNYVS